MPNKYRRPFVMALALMLAMLYSITNLHAQADIFQDLVGAWINTSSDQHAKILIQRSGDVVQQGGPMARLVATIKGGANFEITGAYPDGRTFRCAYDITILPGGTKAVFHLVEQTGKGFTCAQGIFERMAER